MPKPSHKDKLIQSALSEFHEFGFHATGVQSIVDRAGVPKGSFYNHFKSKDALGLEILDVYWSANQTARDTLTDCNRPALERIDTHLAAFSGSEFGCLVGNFSNEMANSEVFRDKLNSFYDTWLSGLSTCIKDGQSDGTIRKDDSPERLAEFIIGALEGAILVRKIDHKDTSLTGFRTSIQKFLST
ncbi:TetR/AcrR family transcriptional regulator [uncultured Roseobacter sp.]|uniref:TetR/AcrR family transcriptional regulator n=1 Tax=uncultured Roseobacter sp. TaxID=114847 RepID=UPI0026124DE9|nr:TetR/AcrR family transcriptional regulator [uncultured Roseobacter sp.]